MVTIKAKGYELEAVPIKDAFNRRAELFKNNIIQSIKRLGLSPDQVDIKVAPSAISRAPAYVSWYFHGKHLHYSHNSRPKYVENLYVVSRVIDLEINALLEERITVEDFIHEFSEDIDVAAQRKEARTVLGLAHDVNDVKVIDKTYKDLARKHHPDSDNGDTEKFQEINNAHKILKRELR